MRYSFILKNRTNYPVEKMCFYMDVSKNAFYYWLNTTQRTKVLSKTMLLKGRIKELFYQSKEIYGSYRIQKQLEREQIYYSRSYSCSNESNELKKYVKT